MSLKDRTEEKGKERRQGKIGGPFGDREREGVSKRRGFDLSLSLIVRVPPTVKGEIE